jgi:hypothetical protein
MVSATAARRRGAAGAAAGLRFFARAIPAF